METKETHKKVYSFTIRVVVICFVRFCFCAHKLKLGALFIFAIFIVFTVKFYNNEIIAQRNTAN